MKPKSIKFVAMTIQEAQTKLLFQLYHYYDNNEAANIADLLMEDLTGWKRIDRITNKRVTTSSVMDRRLDYYISQINLRRPVQYILNESWFYGLKFYVDENVLIPRPETEELAEWILTSERNAGTQRVIDIGTGSGCIAVSLKRNWNEAEIFGLDVSKEALQVAQRNATENAADIQLINLDILDRDKWSAIPACDVIVSNPPYIPPEEKSSLSEHVIEHEPSLALFVNDADPLLFYRAIATLGKTKLNDGGKIYVELHEDYAEQTVQVFRDEGYDVELKKDMQGKNRMLRAGIVSR